MGKATRQKRSYDEAVAELDGLRARIRMAVEEHRWFSLRLAEAGHELKALRAWEKLLLKVVDRGPPAEKPAREMVDNPDRADAQVAFEIERGVEQPGRIEVDVRLASRIGGLSRLGPHLTEPRMVAAARFRSAWDEAQLGGARAIDYSATRVDVSPSVASSEAALALVEDALVAYRDAVQALGVIRANLLQRVICDEMSLRELGQRLGRPVGGKATVALRDEVLDAVDVLVAHFRTGPAPTGRMRGVREGGRLPLRREDGATVIVYADDGGVNNEAA